MKKPNINQQVSKKSIDKKAIIEQHAKLEKAVLKKLPGKARWLVYDIIVIFAFLLYGNTIPFGYVFDDPIVITQNNYTKQGLKGIPKILTTDSFAGIFGEHGGIVDGGRYRPLSIVTFAIEYQLWRANPYATHAINVLMYGFTGVILFMILSKLFSTGNGFTNPVLSRFQKLGFDKHPWYLSLPFIATMLWIAHPLHTEVTANIKERDDIMALLGALLALWYSLRYIETKKIIYPIVSFIAFFLGLLSKENTVTFLAVIPLTLFFFHKHDSNSIKNYIYTFVPALVATLLFIIIRQSILGDAAKNNIPNKLMNNPFLYATDVERYATIVYTFGLYLKLLILPIKLTVDYYPFYIPIIKATDYRFIISFLIHAVIVVYAILTFTKKNIYSYSIWFYLVTFSIVSNVFFPIGTFMGERFMYFPSIGFCIIVAWLFLYEIPNYIQSQNILSEKVVRFSAVGILAVVIVLFSVKTIARNFDWESDMALFTSSAKVSKGSAKSPHVVGELYLYKALETKDKAERAKFLETSIRYSKEGADIHREYVRCTHNLGAALYEQNSANYDTAAYYFVETIKNQPFYTDTYRYILKMVNDTTTGIDLNYKIKLYEQLYGEVRKYDIKKDNEKVVAHNLTSSLGLYYLLQNNLDAAQSYLEKAMSYKNDNAPDYNNMGVVYNFKGDFANAVLYFEKAHQIDPKDRQFITNTLRVYYALGNQQKVAYYTEKLNALNQ